MVVQELRDRGLEQAAALDDLGEPVLQLVPPPLRPRVVELA
jgi:hypothetical protein